MFLTNEISGAKTHEGYDTTTQRRLTSVLVTILIMVRKTRHSCTIASVFIGSTALEQATLGKRSHAQSEDDGERHYGFLHCFIIVELLIVEFLNCLIVASLKL